MSLEWLYSLDELKAYSLATKQGRERLETLLKHLPGMLETGGIRLPRKPRILSLMAGSCIEGIAFAHHYKAQVTCLDLQKRLLTIGAKEARRRKLNLRTVVGDIKQLAKHVTGRFDLVTILGSPLPHLGIFDFDEVVSQVRRVLAKKGAFLVEQADLVFRILPNYRDAFVANLKPPVITVHHSFNPRQGYFERLYYSKTKNRLFRVYLWSPWITEYVLKKNGLSKVEVTPYVSPYTTIQSYLFTART